MENLNYKQIDTEKIKKYIAARPEGVLVDDIMAHSGADRLRVDPALFELEQEGWLTVTERELMGAARRVVVSGEVRALGVESGEWRGESFGS